MRSPDPWQKELLLQIVAKEENCIVCCSRQIGKTEAVAVAAYVVAAIGGFALVLSPSDEQSKEFHSRVLSYHNSWNLVPHTSEPTKHELNLHNHGRVLALPNNERTVRCRSAVDLLIIDEAARVPDALYGAVRPMLAVSRGRTVLLSTPFGRRGFFYREWVGEGLSNWRRHSHPWYHCPRIPEKFVEEERRAHGDFWIQQEYECKFIDANSGFFDVGAFESLIDSSVEVIREW